LFPITTT